MFSLFVYPVVVPHAGTWIEIVITQCKANKRKVVPHAGTWIEIRRLWPLSESLFCRSPRGNVDWNIEMRMKKSGEKVVPHAGTWIEMPLRSRWQQIRPVVPHAGTWIEIAVGVHGPLSLPSFPTRERGLKYFQRCCSIWSFCRSPRGNVDWNWQIGFFYNSSSVVPHAGTWIEIVLHDRPFVSIKVVPHAGTWIEIIHGEDARLPDRSFPTRERGLKYCQSFQSQNLLHRRSPRGNVDWNIDNKDLLKSAIVVPHAGTWIEIFSRTQVVHNSLESFPTRERGLKFLHLYHCLYQNRRSPRGNVDWNYDLEWSNQRKLVVPHAGTWIEIDLELQTLWQNTVVPHAGTWIEI